MSFAKNLKEANWLNLRRVVVYPRIFLFVCAVLGIVWGAGVHLVPHPEDAQFTIDFLNVYTAGVTAHEGHPAEAYDWGAHQEREQKVAQSFGEGNGLTLHEGQIPWLYPPIFLGVAWLVSFLPYFYALTIYLVAGVVAYSVSVCKLARHRAAIGAVVAFPGVYINLLAGQNGFITTALLASGLLLLDESPIAAGMFFAALSYKPQFFVLIPLVLLVGRYWKALAATVVSAGVYAGLSLAAFGLEPWLEFLRGLGLARAFILESDTNRWTGVMHTVFSMVRLYGGGAKTAYALQTGVGLAAIMILAWIWSRRPLSLAVRGAALVSVLFLASPYSFGYDQVVLAIPIALLARQGVQSGFLPFEKTFLLSLWLLPLWFLDSLDHFALPITPLMLAGLLLLCWRRMKVEQANN